MIDSDAFETVDVPGTDRRALRLTDLPGFCYPLYYYIPTIAQGRYLVFHHAHDETVQLHSVDLHTGATRQLTHATASVTQWRPWCTPAGQGVLDHRSALDVTRGAVIYFDGRTVKTADVESGDRTTLFRLPEDRWPIGQNCVTPDGRWFVYIHHDRETFDDLFDGERQAHRHRSRGTALAACDLTTGRHREILRIDSPIHHVTPVDERRLLFCHPATENGMLLTDIEGGFYTHLRTRDAAGGTVCHYHPTDRGIAYEVLRPEGPHRGGLYDPTTHDRIEFDLPASFGYTHTAYDPAGTRWLFETVGETGHEIHYLDRYRAQGPLDWERLVGDWQTYGGGQKAHFHPRLTADRDWLVMVAGTPGTGTNDVYAVDVADLGETTDAPALP